MGWKRCNKCNDMKRVEEFHLDKRTIDGHVGYCKLCRSKYDKKRRENNPEYEKARHKKYQKENMEKALEYQREYIKKNREKRKAYYREYYKKDKERWREYQKNYREEHKEELAIKRRESQKKRWARDPNVRLKSNISKSIWRALKGDKNYRKSEDLIGYPILELKEVLEAQFDKNMTWDNYGSYWEIDHIIPVIIYDFFDEEEIKKCWNKRNLRPLKGIENKSKNGVVSINLILEHGILDLMPEKLIVE